MVVVLLPRDRVDERPAAAGFGEPQGRGLAGWWCRLEELQGAGEEQPAAAVRLRHGGRAAAAR